ncbi:MAG: hypothetical protein QNJ14_18785 [Woeseiaceae bacterium]|nr:hypothetical protein [Woeseiaceae bacterium]
MRRLGFAVLAFIAGVVALFAVQITITKIWSLLGITWGRENLPVVATQQLAALTTLFAAIFGGSLVAAFVSVRDRWRVLAAMGFLGIVIDGYFMFFKIGEALPLWFRVIFVTLIPAATVVAGVISDWLRPYKVGDAHQNEVTEQ